MTKKIFALLITMVMCFTYVSVTIANNENTPFAPSWIFTDEYVVAVGSRAYEPETWAQILHIRNLAETEPAEAKKALNLFRRLGETDVGINFEAALITYKLYLYGENTSSLAVSLTTICDDAHSAARKNPDYENILPVLTIWRLRAALLRANSEEEMKYTPNDSKMLIEYPEFDRKRFFESSDFDHLREYKTFTDMYGLTVYIDDVRFEMDVQPKIVNDRTMLPIRPIAECLGAIVLWDEVNNTASINRAGKDIKIPIGSSDAYVNGYIYTLDSPVFVENGRTYLPLRFIAEQLSQEVEWLGKQEIIKISEDLLFIGESNLKPWILGMCAVIAQNNMGDPYEIGMDKRSAENALHIRKSITSWWGIRSRGDVFTTVNSLLAVSPNSDDSVKAWNLFRVAQIASWGYASGYLTLKEVYELTEPAAIELRKTFTSWDESTKSYLLGFANWSGIDINEKNTKYTMRLQIYRNLYNLEKSEGILFDPDVWTQEVRGIE